MKVTYDKIAKAAYIFMKDLDVRGKVAKTIPVTDNIIIDIGPMGELMGVEILNPELSIGKSNLKNLKKEKFSLPIVSIA